MSSSSLALTAYLPFRAARLVPAAIACAGLALRLAFSRAPLWNDEIWSLLNLRTVDGLPGVLWGLSHDNNHFLNSIWLLVVSPVTSDPTALRLLSILAGTATIVLMTRLGARQDVATGVAAAALTALSFFQVVYSVEARGYAVATLALVSAFSELEAARPSRLRLALAAGVGVFAHLAFAPALAALALAEVCERLRQGRRPPAALAETSALFGPAALACLPTLGCVAAGYFHRGGFTIGSLTPFSAAHATAGIATLAMMTFGLDSNDYAQTAFALTGLPMLVAGAIAWAAPARRRAVYLVMLIGLPTLAFVAELPNTHAARYFFSASPFLILLASDAFGSLWRRGGLPRALAVVGLATALAGDAAALARLMRGEASPWTDALARVAASPDRSLASSHDFNVARSVAWFNLSRGEAIELVPPERFCEREPSWFVVETRGDARAEPARVAGAPLCPATYRLEAVFDRDVPSQLPWALYRR